MCLEDQPRRRSGSTQRVVVGVANSKLATNGEIAIVGDIIDHPGGETLVVAVVAALLSIRRSVEIAVEVHLFARIVGVNVLTITHHLVYRVLNAVDASCHRMLSDTNGVSQAPSKTCALRIEAIASVRDAAQVESANLAVT